MIPLLFVAVPRPLAASPSLALGRSDYPHGTLIEAYPATDAEADERFERVHRSSFEQLHRIDGAGWVQAGLWHFHVGRGAARVTHTVTFGYAVNVFSSHARARAALGDVKLPVQPYRVAHLAALRYSSSDAHLALEFLFFVTGSVEVETYYEYMGAAPARVAHELHHTFSRQTSHLAARARQLNRALHQSPPTPAPSPSPSATATPTPTSLPSPAPTATSRPTSTPTPAPTATSTPSPTPTPAGLVVQPSMAQSSYAPGALAVVQVRVTNNSVPVAGADVAANVLFPGNPETCEGVTDASGMASCSVSVPNVPNGTVVRVWTQVFPPGEQPVTPPQITFVVYNT